MVDIFPRPDFEKVFGFEPNQYGKHWEASRIEQALKNFAQKARTCEIRTWDVFYKIPELVSDIDLRKWHLDCRIAVMELERAVDEFCWAYLLAKRAGFTVRNVLAEYPPYSHA